jgi:hypothetical protein
VAPSALSMWADSRMPGLALRNNPVRIARRVSQGVRPHVLAVRIGIMGSAGGAEEGSNRGRGQDLRGGPHAGPPLREACRRRPPAEQRPLISVPPSLALPGIESKA